MSYQGNGLISVQLEISKGLFYSDAFFPVWTIPNHCLGFVWQQSFFRLSLNSRDSRLESSEEKNGLMS